MWLIALVLTKVLGSTSHSNELVEVFYLTNYNALSWPLGGGHTLGPKLVEGSGIFLASTVEVFYLNYNALDWSRV